MRHLDAKHPAHGASRGGVGNADPIGVAISKNDITAPATIQAAKRREPYRYCVCIRPDLDGWECLLVDQGGDSGGWQEATDATWMEAFFKAIEITRNPSHRAFCAPLFFETEDSVIPTS